MVAERKAESHVLENENEVEDDCVYNHKRGYCQPEGETRDLLIKLYAKQAGQEEKLRKYKQSGDNPHFDTEGHVDYHKVNGRRIDKQYNKFTGSMWWEYTDDDDEILEDWD